MGGPTGSARLDASIKVGYTQPRFRYAIWALTAVSIVCLVYFGTKNAGSYAGYEAGSLYQPQSYVDTWYTETFGDASGMTDDELNDYLGGMRAKNLPGVIVGVVGLVASLGVAYLAGEGWVRNVGLAAATLEHTRPAWEFFSAAYANDDTYQAKDHLERGSSVSLGQYAVLAMCLPEADNGLPGSTIDAAGVAETRHDLDNVYGKAYLALEGLRLDAEGHVGPLLDAVSVTLPSLNVHEASPAGDVTPSQASAPGSAPRAGQSFPAPRTFAPSAGPRASAGRPGRESRPPGKATRR